MTTPPNKELKLTKPSIMELRSLTPVFGGPEDASILSDALVGMYPGGALMGWLPKVRASKHSGWRAAPFIGVLLSNGCCDIGSIRTQSLPDAFVGEPYDVTLLHNCSGQSSLDSATWTTKSLVPSGLSLSRNGRLSGTPRVGGEYLVTVDLAVEAGEYDYGGVVDSKEFALSIRVSAAGGQRNVQGTVVSACAGRRTRG